MAIALDTPRQSSLPFAQVSGRRRRGRKQSLAPLFDGTSIRCPRCRNTTRIEAMERLPEMPVYEHETVPVFKCKCSWIFALNSNPVRMPR